MDNQGLKILTRKQLRDSVCVVVGTRPGIVKMSSIIKELKKKNLESFVLHTGQHYSYEMDKKFFEDLGLPSPLHHLQPGRQGSLHGEQTARMLLGIESVLVKEKPRLVLVCGDANTNLAGALAARKLQIEVGHVESGLRSNDWRMPEEHNRVIIDHISEYLFAPTRQSKENLIKDNVKGKIFVTGNTIVDALIEHIAIAEDRSDVLRRLQLKRKGFILVTCHREENVDDEKNLKDILDGITLIGSKLKVPIVFPVHPRTLKRLEGFNIKNRLTDIPHLKVIVPVGYLDFLLLLHSALLIITDSGGIQEESCILRVPCVTLRENTERRETVDVGANIIAGTEPKRILDAAQKMLKRKQNWINPFGDGKAAERIVDIISGRQVNEFEIALDSL